MPAGIAAEDACYLPAVETALALVQDAQPIVGENIAVYGQVAVSAAEPTMTCAAVSVADKASRFDAAGGG